MIRVVFVCTGNICRSPMAEAIMSDLVAKAGLSDQIEVDSAGMIGYHSEEMADPRARQELAEHDIEYYGSARQVIDEDFEAEYLIGMTQSHVEELNHRKPKWSNAQIHLLLDYADEVDRSEVPDPYYVGGFDAVYNLIEKGCRGFLDYLIQAHQLES